MAFVFLAGQFLVTLILIGVLSVQLSVSTEKSNPFSKYNVLIISVCSLRSDDIFSSNLEKIAPNLFNFLNRSTLFKNGYATFPYTHFRYYLSELSHKAIMPNNFHFIGQGRLLKELKDWNIPPDEAPPLFFNYAEKGLASYAIQTLIKRSSFQEARPFVSLIHFKDLHRPYYTNELRPYLDKSTAAYVSELFTGPKFEEAQIPLYRLLFSSEWFVKNKIESRLELPISNDDLLALYRTREEQIINIHDNKRLLEKWQSSANFSKDLRSLRTIYRAQISLFDKTLKPLLEKYANGQNEDTIIIFLGDHGEAFMEHGKLFHATDVYDEMIAFPLAIHFPNQNEKIEIDSQVSFQKLTQWIKLYLHQKVTSLGVGNLVSTLKDDYIVSVNCAKDVYSVRYMNSWKLIHRELNDTFELYDLNFDPYEHRNVLSEEPEIARMLKIYLLENKYSKLINTGSLLGCTSY
ncbi:MAG: sulfatase-like hydrolase/transferase [Bdellovibrionales bacterium]|nr:sulfatase-like hydrolase/transferase [Bdellovibrionales bacterium]